MEGRELTIGILSLQGAFIEHEKALERLSRDSGGIISSRQVKQAHHLQGLDGLIIPGGESTVMKRLVTVDTAAGSNLLKALIQWTLVDKMPTMVSPHGRNSQWLKVLGNLCWCNFIIQTR